MKTPYSQIVDVNKIASFNNQENIEEIISLGKQESPSQNEKRTLLLAIDLQNDFMEDIGTLQVKGTRGDVERLTKWIYNNVDHLSQIMCSLDCHSVRQIFFPDWWIDKNGINPQPFTIITYQDVINEKWLPVNEEIERSLEYLENLELEGKKQLCIWPYHCLEGTNGAKLESEFTKMIYFHSVVKNSTPILIYKGQNPYTEMYGIIKAEYDKSKFINQQILDTIKEFDEIYIAGEASSHCLLFSVKQIVEYFAEDKDLTSRITLLSDCMSPIAGFEDVNAEFEQLKTDYGIKIEPSTNVKL